MKSSRSADIFRSAGNNDLPPARTSAISARKRLTGPAFTWQQTRPRLIRRPGGRTFICLSPGCFPRFICSPDRFTAVLFPVQLFCCLTILLRVLRLRPSGPTGNPWGQTASITLGRPCLVLAGVLAGGPLGFLPEAAGEGVRVCGHGAGQGAVAGFDAEVAGEVILVIPGGRPDRGRLDRVQDGGVSLLDAAQHPLVGVLGGAAVEDPARGCLAGVAAEFLRGGDDRRRDLGQPPARLQDQQVPGPVTVRVEESTANRRPVTGEITIGKSVVTDHIRAGVQDMPD